MSWVVSAFLVLGVHGSAFASQVSCEDTIKQAVQETLASENSQEVVTGSPIAVKHLASTALYVASSASAYNPDVPMNKTKWSVFVKIGEQSTCQVLAVSADEQISQ